MPAPNRVGGEQGANLRELFAAQNLAFDDHATSLLISYQDSLLAALLFENGVLAVKVLNDFLLLPIDPNGEGDQHQLPLLQNELHQRLGDPENPSRSLVCREMYNCEDKRERNRRLPSFRRERLRKHSRRGQACPFG